MAHAGSSALTQARPEALVIPFGRSTLNDKVLSKPSSSSLLIKRHGEEGTDTGIKYSDFEALL
jgi:hypothetical protein